MTFLRTEVKTVQEDTEFYEQSPGAVKSGKSVSVSEKFALGICIRGIPEKNANCLNPILWRSLFVGEMTHYGNSVFFPSKKHLNNLKVFLLLVPFFGIFYFVYL